MKLTCHACIGWFAVVRAAGVEMGAQSNFYEKKGAYTGATSTSMVKVRASFHLQGVHRDISSVADQSRSQ